MNFGDIAVITIITSFKFCTYTHFSSKLVWTNFLKLIKYWFMTNVFLLYIYLIDNLALNNKKKTILKVLAITLSYKLWINFLFIIITWVFLKYMYIYIYQFE